MNWRWCRYWRSSSSAASDSLGVGRREWWGGLRQGLSGLGGGVGEMGAEWSPPTWLRWRIAGWREGRPSGWRRGRAVSKRRMGDSSRGKSLFFIPCSKAWRSCNGGFCGGRRYQWESPFLRGDPVTVNLLLQVSPHSLSLDAPTFRGTSAFV